MGSPSRGRALPPCLAPPYRLPSACFSDVSPPTLISLPLPSPRCHQMLRPPPSKRRPSCAPRTVIILLTISAFRCECSNTAALMEEPRFSRIESLSLFKFPPCPNEGRTLGDGSRRQELYSWVTEADEHHCDSGRLDAHRSGPAQTLPTELDQRTFTKNSAELNTHEI